MINYNVKIFFFKVNRLAELVNIRSENDMTIFTSGCIINMNGFHKDDTDGGSSKEKGIQAIRTTAAAFEVIFDFFFKKKSFLFKKLLIFF